MVDLRPDPTVTDGFALVAGNGIVSLADAIASDPGDTIGPVVRTLLGNKLGLTLQSATIKDVLAELLFRRGNKWNPCAASLSRKIKEIYIGGELWASMPFDPGPQGDTDPSDNFSGTDANPIGGNWTTTSGLAALRRISNQLANAGSDADSGAWWNAATFSSDHWSEITFAAVGSASDCGPAVRCQSGAATFYCAATYNPGEAFYKMVSGTASAISGVTTPNAANGDTVRCEAEARQFDIKRTERRLPAARSQIPAFRREARREYSFSKQRLESHSGPARISLRTRSFPPPSAGGIGRTRDCAGRAGRAGFNARSFGARRAAGKI
jgi:hypothetical protein